jgi:hypothetical protein
MPRGVYPRKPGWKPACYKGGSYMSRGYRYVMTGERYPNGRAKYTAEHRQVMEKHLGRTLQRFEHPHHKNQRKDDNRPENLELLTAIQHQHIHHAFIERRSCIQCGKAYKPDHGHRPSKYCSHACEGKAQILAKNSYICLQCKRSFRRRGRRVAKTCSPVCREKARALGLIGRKGYPVIASTHRPAVVPLH